MSDNKQGNAMNNHTVAPWNTVKTLGGKVYIVGVNSEAVAEVTSKNAPLVAAAPELYKALDELCTKMIE